MRGITDKDMDRARKAALKRWVRDIDEVIVNVATGTVLTPERLMEEHIGREQELLARIGYKLNTRNVRGIAEVAAEAPTPASLFEDARELWNTEADKIAARFPDGGFFPLRLRLAPTGGYHFAPAALKPGSNWQHWAHSLEVLLYCSVLERKLAADIGRKPAELYHVLLEPFREANRQAEIYDWMAGFLLMSRVPETFIKRQASGRESRWNKVLRKTKIGMALNREAFLRDALMTLRENQHQETKRSTTFPPRTVRSTSLSRQQARRCSRDAKTHFPCPTGAIWRCRPDNRPLG